jgi:hypothetical protein
MFIQLIDQEASSVCVGCGKATSIWGRVREGQFFFLQWIAQDEMEPEMTQQRQYLLEGYK